jgi:hypothetical protein
MDSRTQAALGTIHYLLQLLTTSPERMSNGEAGTRCICEGQREHRAGGDATTTRQEGTSLCTVGRRPTPWYLCVRGRTTKWRSRDRRYTTTCRPGRMRHSQVSCIAVLLLLLPERRQPGVTNPHHGPAALGVPPPRTETSSEHRQVDVDVRGLGRPNFFSNGRPRRNRQCRRLVRSPVGHAGR